MKLKMSLKMVILKLLIFLDIHFLRNKDFECRLSYDSGYMDNGSFTNKEMAFSIKINILKKGRYQIRQQLKWRKPIFAKLLNLVEKEKLKPLVELIAESGSDLYQLMVNKPVNKPLNPNAIEDFIVLTPRLLGNNGLMWFDHIEVVKVEDKILILRVKLR